MLPLIPLFATLYRFGRAIRAGLSDPEFEALLTFLVIILASGTIFYHEIEAWSWLDSLYFSVITITTVGYGDLTPHTVIGKIFTMFYLFIGIGTLLTFVTYIARHAVAEGVENPLLRTPQWMRRTRTPELASINE
jgi:voltage-gated potassium channel